MFISNNVYKFGSEKNTKQLKATQIEHTMYKKHKHPVPCMGKTKTYGCKTHKSTKERSQNQSKQNRSTMCAQNKLHKRSKNTRKTLNTRKILSPVKHTLATNLTSRKGRQHDKTTQPDQLVRSQTRCHVDKNFFSVSTFKTKRTNQMF